MQDAFPQWHSFMEGVARYAAPSALGDCFAGELSDETCSRLLDMERLQPRLSSLMRARLPVWSQAHEISEADRRIALLDAGDLEMTALRIGAILSANGLAGTIAGPRAIAIREALGAEAIMIALENRALSDADVDLTEVDDIQAHVLARGMAFLAGWANGLPEAVRARMELKLPELAQIEPVEDARLPALIEKASP